MIDISNIALEILLKIPDEFKNKIIAPESTDNQKFVGLVTGDKETQLVKTLEKKSLSGGSLNSNLTLTQLKNLSRSLNNLESDSDDKPHVTFKLPEDKPNPEPNPEPSPSTLQYKKYVDASMLGGNLYQQKPYELQYNIYPYVINFLC